MFNRVTWASVCLIGLAALGCSKETTSSANIKTGGIAALIDVYADTDATATVRVKLVVGGSSSNTYVALEGGDTLTATAGGKSKPLTTSDTGIYEAAFSGVAADTEFQVTLDRPDDTTATGNSGTLPPPFTLDKPAVNLSRLADDLEVSWAPADSGDGMQLNVDGTCIFSYDHSLSDTGTFTIVKGTLESTGGDKPETCDLDLQLQRDRAGVVDAKFDPESWFRLHQRRSTSFTSKP